ncbi:MAG: hypothetical protein Q8N88_06990 [Nanoarchaeota archaeon]|nr:hypothetical protein [Nanoarchaeota archaeon]
MINAKAGPYWVYFEANASDTLEKIDEFLRDLWLECCGHLSMFRIGNDIFASSPEYEDKSMDVSLNKVLKTGVDFSHEYDFGTTTYLNMKCVSERTGNKLKDIEILAINEMPECKCKCGKDAKEICTECLWNDADEAFLCEECAKKHDCGDEMFLPVVNSPRMGMCGYTGEY